MKVRVDGRKCQGHNRCYLTCPEVFEIDEYGQSSARSEDLPADLEDRVLLAARNCPERAIQVSEHAAEPEGERSRTT